MFLPFLKQFVITGGISLSASLICSAQAPRSNGPAQPAAVSMKNGELTVNAANSDLSQILRDVARVSGMTIKGLGEGPRIFGVYGPGNSRVVLDDLLVDSGYNFIIVGGADGTLPRELFLTKETPSSAGAPAAASPTDSSKVEPPPSAASRPNPPEAGENGSRVQENMQRLLQMRAQQKNPQQ